MKGHIFEPLGLADTTFRLDEVLKTGKPFADLAVKVDGKLVYKDGTVQVRNPNVDHGGGGLFSSASDYLKILVSILKDDGKLLKPETAALLFEPQVKNTAKLQAMMKAPAPGVTTDRYPNGMGYNYGLGGMLNLIDLPRRRAKNSIKWSGMANLNWVSPTNDAIQKADSRKWIDRESGVCGCVFEQLLPSGDAASSDLVRDFEEYVYRVVKSG
jgi:CubicO group peptidase (beta-lactamase class C family)